MTKPRTNEDLFGYPRPFYPATAAENMRHIAEAVASALRPLGTGFKAVQFADIGSVFVYAYLVHDAGPMNTLDDTYQVPILREALGMSPACNVPAGIDCCRTIEDAVMRLVQIWPQRPEVALAAARAARAWSDSSGAD